MAKINIVPRKGSRKFSRNIKVEYYDNAENERDGIASKVEDYDEEFWQGTNQYIKATYWWAHRRFAIVDPEDPKRKKLLENNSEKLNELVAKCNLRYPIDHPDPSLRGKRIEKCDIFDDTDAFLGHEELEFKIESGDAGIDDQNPINEVMLLILLADERFALGGKNHTGPMNPKVRWVVVDADLDRRYRKHLRKQDRKAREELIKITNNKSNLLKYSILLGLVHDVDTDLNFEDLEDQLYEYAIDQKTMLPKENKTPQEKFLEIVDAGQEILDAGYAFNQGIQWGVVKKLEGAYQAFGIILGRDREQCISFLTDEKQESLLDRIQVAVDTLKPASSKTIAKGKVLESKIEEEE